MPGKSELALETVRCRTASIDMSAGNYPLTGLSSDLAYEIEVLVVVQQDQAFPLCCCRDEEIGDLAAFQTARCECSLDAEGTGEVLRKNQYRWVDTDGSAEHVPFLGISGRKPDLQV